MNKRKKPAYDRRKFTLKERFSYWFDNRVTKGSLGLMWNLIELSVIFAIIIAGIILMLGFNEQGEVDSVLWNGIATLINSWMPFYEDGSRGYLVLMTVTAIAGLLFTSVLIGIITSGIEEKIEDLKRGNSLVLEKGHIVVLGFYPGEFALLEQLILAAAGRPACVVVAEDMERADMEQAIRENLKVPKNFKIISRTVDITDPASLEKCSVDTCKTVIVSPTEDMRTIKTVLAVTTLLEEKGIKDIRINAIISRREHQFPTSLAEANNITTLQMNSIMAQMIAHSCTQTGLSQTFREIFNFEGAELYLMDMEGLNGMTFGDLMMRLNNAVPVGLYRCGKAMLNPPGDLALEDTDRVIVFTEEFDSAKLVDGYYPVISEEVQPFLVSDDQTETLVIGYNDVLPIIIQELPENVKKVQLAGQNSTKEERDALRELAASRNMELEYHYKDVQSEEYLLKLAGTVKHIVILNDHNMDAEMADMYGTFLLLKLRDIRKKYYLSFNITVEMRLEHNQKLVGRGDHTDFIVSSSMSSLLLAQLAESPELLDVFNDLLRNEGNEIYLKNTANMQLEGEYTVRELREILLRHRYILLGDLDKEKRSTYNRPLEEKIVLNRDIDLIVIGEN